MGRDCRLAFHRMMPGTLLDLSGLTEVVTADRPYLNKIMLMALAGEYLVGISLSHE